MSKNDRQKYLDMYDNLDKRLGGFSGEVSLRALFPDTFVQNNSEYKTLEELFAGAVFRNQEEFDAWVETEDAEKLVTTRTKFPGWETMAGVAYTQYLQQKLIGTSWGTWDEKNSNSEDRFEMVKVTFDVTPGL